MRVNPLNTSSKLIMKTLLLAIFASSAVGFSAKHTVTLEFKALKDSYKNKQLYIGYWSETQAANFPKANTASYSQQALITDHNFNLETELPAGTYAVSAFIDLNGNGKLDTNLFGAPKEPYCFSKNYRPTFSATSFTDCSFDTETQNKLSLSMID